MHKVKIRLPAVLTSLGPGLNSLALALSLYTQVEVSPRRDSQLVVETEGEGAGRYSLGLRHPVVLALARVFQRMERAPLGLNVRVSSDIPPASGLGAETAFLLAGVIAGNTLMDSPYDRHGVLTFAAQISRPESAVGAMLGGLTLSLLHESHGLIYRSLPAAQFPVVVVLPALERYTRPTPLERVPLSSLLYNSSRTPLLIEALRTGDQVLLAQCIDDAIQVPRQAPQIRGLAAATQAARDAGALAVTIAGDGPAVLAFAEGGHAAIAEAMRDAFDYAGVAVRAWVLPVDTQGVVLSVLSFG